MTIILMVAGLTFVCGLIAYILKLIVLDMQVEPLAFLRIMSIETLYNIIIAIILYPLIKNSGNLIERIFTQKKILTREF